MSTYSDVSAVFQNLGRFLLFQPIKPDFARHRILYLLIGIGSSWLAGIGRYWDHPHAEWWQYLGLGSVAYIFFLSTILFLLLWPLRPSNWSYLNVLTFVGMTAPPGLLYAIPVERVMDMSMAQAVNGWFLAIVAAWRVALLWRFLSRTAKLPFGIAVVALLLPLALILFTLSTLNLEKAVFEIMVGRHPTPPTSHDRAWFVVLMLTVVSVYASPFLLIGYLVMIYDRQKNKAVSGLDSIENENEETP